MVAMVTKQKILINFTFFEAVRDETIAYKNFTLLGQGSHEIPGGSSSTPPPLVSDEGTNTLGNRRVNNTFK